MPIKQRVSQSQCYAIVRQLRWGESVTCPHCDSGDTIRRGYDKPATPMPTLPMQDLLQTFRQPDRNGLVGSSLAAVGLGAVSVNMELIYPTSRSPKNWN